MRMLTPDYASPEQVTGGRVSTATDIYSLGAVLYKLLTGRPVHEFDDHSPEAILSSVTTREVMRPSLIAPELKGDLDAILLTALRKNPQERYATVEQFADDLSAFVESRTVTARSGDAWYRTRKFLRRYWVPVTATMLVILSLSVGLGVANRQRRVAERRFSQLHQLAHQLLFDLDPELSGIPNAMEARKKLLATSTQYLAGLSADAIDDEQLSLEVAQSYMQVARIQGVPAWNNLGQYAEAMESLRKAEAFLQPVLAANPDNRDALWLSANVAHDRCSASNFTGHNEEVLASAPIVAMRFNHLAQLGNLSRKEINGATFMYTDIADDHIDMHRFEDAVRYARAAIEISRTNATVAGPRAHAFGRLATALKCLGDFPEALDAIRQARNEWQKYHDGGLYHRAYGANALAEVRRQEGLILADDYGVDLNRPSEAVAIFQQGLDAVEEIVQEEPKDFHSRHRLAMMGLGLANVIRHSNARQAFDIYDHALSMIRVVPGDGAPRRLEAWILAASSYPARSLHRESEARNRIDAAVQLLRGTKDYPAAAIRPDSEADIVLVSLADHYADTGQPNKAIETYQDLVRKNLASNPDPQNDLVNAACLSRNYASLAGLLKRVGRKDEAGDLENRQTELWSNWNRKLPNNPFVLRQRLGL
jgi:serine/threonine-protein kinase